MGRTALILVLGASLIFVTIAPNIYHTASFAYQNYLDYYTAESMHDLGESAANMAASAIFFNSNWRTGFASKSFGNGSYKVNVQNITYQGDSTMVQINAISTFQGQTDTVSVLLHPSSFAKFCVYINSMGSVYFATGDSVFGPLHVEGTLNALGTPYFQGKVTVKNGTNPVLPSAQSHPSFLGGYQSGVSIPLPASLTATSNAASAGGKVFTPPASPSGNYSVYVTFNNDGTMNYQEFKGTTQTNSGTNVPITTLAPNGVIMVNGGNLYLHGTLKGQATIGALQGSGNSTNAGNVFINGNITYNTDPRTNPSSTDMLGVVSDNNITIPLPTTGPPPPATAPYPPGPPYPQHDFTIEGALFARTGQFSAQYVSQMGVLGHVTVVGGVTSNTIGAFAAGDAYGNVLYGYSNTFSYDNRFMVGAPPSFPNTGLFEILSWKE